MSVGSDGDLERVIEELLETQTGDEGSLREVSDSEMEDYSHLRTTDVFRLSQGEKEAAISRETYVIDESKDPLICINRGYQPSSRSQIQYFAVEDEEDPVEVYQKLLSEGREKSSLNKGVVFVRGGEKVARGYDRVGT